MHELCSGRPTKFNRSSLWRNWNWINAHFFLWSFAGGFLYDLFYCIRPGQCQRTDDHEDDAWLEAVDVSRPFFAYSWGRDEDDGLVCSFLAAAVHDGTDNKKCIPAFNIFTKIRHDNKQLGNANVANCFPLLLLLLPSHPPRHPPHSAYTYLVLSPKER